MKRLALLAALVVACATVPAITSTLGPAPPIVFLGFEIRAGEGVDTVVVYFVPTPVPESIDSIMGWTYEAPSNCDLFVRAETYHLLPVPYFSNCRIRGRRTER